MTSPTPTEIFRLIGHLSTGENTQRAADALHLIMLQRGHGAGTELQNALPLSRSSLNDYRRHTVPMAPATVYRLAVIYTSGIPDTPEAVDWVTANGNLDDADTLFNLFYADDPRAARDWLVEHRPHQFPRPTLAAA